MAVRKLLLKLRDDLLRRGVFFLIPTGLLLKHDHGVKQLVNLGLVRLVHLVTSH